MDEQPMMPGATAADRLCKMGGWVPPSLDAAFNVAMAKPPRGFEYHADGTTTYNGIQIKVSDDPPLAGGAGE